MIFSTLKAWHNAESWHGYRDTTSHLPSKSQDPIFSPGLHRPFAQRHTPGRPFDSPHGRRFQPIGQILGHAQWAAGCCLASEGPGPSGFPPHLGEIRDLDDRILWLGYFMGWMCVCVYINICIYVYIYIHTHVYTCVYIYIHIQHIIAHYNGIWCILIFNKLNIWGENLIDSTSSRQEYAIPCYTIASEFWAISRLHGSSPVFLRQNHYFLNGKATSLASCSIFLYSPPFLFIVPRASISSPIWVVLISHMIYVCCMLLRSHNLTTPHLACSANMTCCCLNPFCWTLNHNVSRANPHVSWLIRHIVGEIATRTGL